MKQSILCRTYRIHLPLRDTEHNVEGSGVLLRPHPLVLGPQQLPQRRSIVGDLWKERAHLVDQAQEGPEVGQTFRLWELGECSRLLGVRCLAADPNGVAKEVD